MDAWCSLSAVAAGMLRLPNLAGSARSLSVPLGAGLPVRAGMNLWWSVSSRSGRKLPMLGTVRARYSHNFH